MRVVLALPLVLVACDPCGPSCGALADVPATAELAAPGTPFTPLEDGATLGFWKGGQGGFHVVGGVRTTGLRPGDGRLDTACVPTVDFDVHGVDQDLDDGWFPFPGLFTQTGGARGEADWLNEVIVLGISDADEADGSEVDVSVVVSDTCGRTASDTVRVTLSYEGTTDRIPR